MTAKANIKGPVTAVLDDAHLGHIQGAIGTILQGDVAPRETWKHRLTTPRAILGPGLIVMAGDNDAGAFRDPRPGRPKLRHDAAVDDGAADPGALRAPGEWLLLVAVTGVGPRAS